MNTWRLSRSHWIGITLLGSLVLGSDALSQGARGNDLEKRDETQQRMELLAAGIFGSGTGGGYLSDMGRVPAALAELAASSGSPAYSTSNQGSVGMGFNGPYVSRIAASSSQVVDAWGSPIEIVAGTSDLRLRSAGPDRDASTDTDNLYHPVQARTTHGTIEVTVTSIPSSGGAATPLTGSDVTLTVYYASNGAQASTSAAYTGSGGVFRAQNVHVGRHYVSVTATTPADYSVSTRSDVVALRGRKVSASLQLTQADPVTVCHSSVTTSVTPSTLQAHLGHGDTQGACAATPTPTPTPTPAPSDDVTLCHNPGRNQQTKTVPQSAASGHLGHGDTLGACP